MLRWLNIAFFTGLAAVNILANALPIAGVKTEEIAEKYQNLLSPADYTFMIWGVIYFLLAGFVIFQASKKRAYITEKCRGWFALSCVFNSLWMVLWHYDLIGLSVVCMALLLISLIVLLQRLGDVRHNWQEKMWVQAGFGLYLGWVTVATILNVTSWLVKTRWTAWGISPALWAMLLLLLGALLTLASVHRYHNGWFGVAVIWGYGGIIAQHVKGYQLQYGWVIAAGVVTIALLLWPIYRALTGKEKAHALE